MVKVSLSSSLSHCVVIADPPSRATGSPASPDRRTIVKAPVRCTSASGEIDLSFHVRGELLNGKLPRMSPESRGQAVAIALIQSAWVVLPQSRRWQWYGVQEIEISAPVVAPPKPLGSLDKDVEITPELAEALRAEAELRRKVASLFGRAKAFLLQKLSTQFGNDAGKIGIAGQYLEACFDNRVRMGDRSLPEGWAIGWANWRIRKNRAKAKCAR